VKPFEPPLTVLRRDLAVVGAIFVVGAIAALTANLVLKHQVDTGIPFFRVAEDAHGPGPVRVVIDATGPVHDLNTWVSPAEAKLNAHDPGYMSLDHGKPLLEVVRPGGHERETELPFGDYNIEMDAGEGKTLRHFNETLHIFAATGEVKQSIVVKQNGKTVLEYRPWGQ